METFSALLALCAGNSPFTAFPSICARINSCTNNREADDLRCHRTHYVVTVMLWTKRKIPWSQFNEVCFDISRYFFDTNSCSFEGTQIVLEWPNRPKLWQAPNPTEYIKFQSNLVTQTPIFAAKRLHRAAWSNVLSLVETGLVTCVMRASFGDISTERICLG